MPSQSKHKTQRLPLKVLLCIFLPIPLVIMGCFYLAKMSLDDELKMMASSYIRQLEEVVDELRDENKQALYDADTCEQIQHDLLFEAFLREMFIIKDHKITCSSKRSINELQQQLNLHITPEKVLTTGEFLFDFPYDDSNVRSLLVIDANINNPNHLAISVVDQSYIDLRLGLKTDDRIQASQMTVGDVTYPSGSHVENQPYATQAKSKYLNLQVTIEPSKKLVMNKFSYYFVIGIPISLLLSLLLYLLYYWFNSKNSLFEDLKKGLKQGEFHLVYQPITDCQSGNIFGFEALLRWENDKHGRVSPDIFIPIAEQNKYINTITDFVLEQTLKDLKKLKLTEPMHIGVNVPPEYIVTPHLIEKMTHLVAEYQKANLKLAFEITERQLLTKDSHSILSQLRKLGIEIYIDDFGTGFTSLAILQDIEFDCLKIDRCFINTIGIE
ncbi:MAG: EAL domain-containing protein, partial [Vibrio sp.]